MDWVIWDGCCIEGSPLREEMRLDWNCDSLRAFLLEGRTPRFVVGPLGDVALYVGCTFFQVSYLEEHTPSDASAPSGAAGPRGVSDIGRKGRGEVRTVDHTRGSTSCSFSFRTMYWFGVSKI